MVMTMLIEDDDVDGDGLRMTRMKVLGSVVMTIMMFVMVLSMASVVVNEEDGGSCCLLVLFHHKSDSLISVTALCTMVVVEGLW